MKAKKDGIYRASLRGDSIYVRARAENVSAELKADSHVEAGKRTLVETRRMVESGWRNLADDLAKDGHQHLARDVQLFVEQMPPPRTEKELTAQLIQHIQQNRHRHMDREALSR